MRFIITKQMTECQLCPLEHAAKRCERKDASLKSPLLRRIEMKNHWERKRRPHFHKYCNSLSAQALKRSVCFMRKQNQNISWIPRISSRGTGSAFYISQHEWRVSPRKPSQYQKRLFAINVHCRKTTSFDM